ncbi:MAG: Phosphotransferase system, phosphocarrier protein HPr, partial [uncultured Gemmatimonadaceae bacterium]
ANRQQERPARAPGRGDRQGRGALPERDHPAARRPGGERQEHHGGDDARRGVRRHPPAPGHRARRRGRAVGDRRAHREQVRRVV